MIHVAGENDTCLLYVAAGAAGMAGQRRGAGASLFVGETYILEVRSPISTLISSYLRLYLISPPSSPPNLPHSTPSTPVCLGILDDSPPF